MTSMRDRQQVPIANYNARTRITGLQGAEVTGGCRHVGGGAGVHDPLAAVGVLLLDRHLLECMDEPGLIPAWASGSGRRGRGDGELIRGPGERWRCRGTRDRAENAGAGVVGTHWYGHAWTIPVHGYPAAGAGAGVVTTGAPLFLVLVQPHCRSCSCSTAPAAVAMVGWEQVAWAVAVRDHWLMVRRV